MLRRQSDVRNGVRQVRPTPNGLLKSLEIGPRLEFVVNFGRIEERADRVRSEVRRGPHELAGKLPVGKIIALQFDEVSFRIPVIKRHCKPVIEAERRLDATL